MKREYDFRNAKQGAVVSVSKRKTRITIRLDEEILAWFRSQVNRAGGGSYQTLINEALRQHIQRTREGETPRPGPRKTPRAPRWRPGRARPPARARSGPLSFGEAPGRLCRPT